MKPVTTILITASAMFWMSCARNLPEPFRGTWECRQQDSNRLSLTTMRIARDEVHSVMDVRSGGDSTNLFFSIDRSSTLVPEGWRTARDGRRAYAIAMRVRTATALPHTAEACQHLHMMWGITNWTPGEPRTEKFDEPIVDRELLWIDSQISPQRLFLGAVPPEGRMTDITPDTIETNMYFERRDTSNNTVGSHR